MSEDMKVMVAGNTTAGGTCSICQTTIIRGEHVVKCDSCTLPFHHECWEENKGCSAYGCESAPVVEKVEAGADELGVTSWGGEKACPSCRKTIKSQALKCRFCGAKFSSRHETSSEEFSKREYTGRKYNEVRNKIIVLFFASATGFLSPIMIFVTGTLVLSGSLGKIELKRLPGSMKVLAILTFGLNCFLVFVLFLLIVFD